MAQSRTGGDHRLSPGLTEGSARGRPFPRRACLVVGGVSGAADSRVIVNMRVIVNILLTETRWEKHVVNMGLSEKDRRSRRHV